MKIILAGGTGFLGRSLAGALRAEGHHVVVLTRRPRSNGEGLRYVRWDPDGQIGPWAVTLEGADGVVNLAGEPIAARRWTPAQKERLRASRRDATGSLARAIRAMPRPPPVLVNASAVGYYGSRGEEELTERSAPGADFLATVCVKWEADAEAAHSARTRVALVRTGIVLERDGGALAKMLLPFRLFAGGPIGSGRQYMSWIHRADWIDLVRWILRTPAADGPINATAPNPVTNATFSRALGRAIHRPALLPTPAFALRLALGEMADALLLSSQRVLPARAVELGFEFRYTNLDSALAAIFPS